MSARVALCAAVLGGCLSLAFIAIAPPLPGFALAVAEALGWSAWHERNPL